ncbi:dermonecrotic toxin domain-containing protein [Pseudomonas sp. AMR01]|uniref:dermonecrotic toxin domain-containing protein n=1 Tax=Pseudomonas sp. AMR01 TaxID=3064904 RepID=UPI0035C13EA1
MLSVRNTPRAYVVSLPDESPSPAQAPVLNTPVQPPASRAQSLPRGIQPQRQRVAADTPATVVAEHFASRPSVRSVVAELLAQALKAQYPTLEIDIANTSLAVPVSANPLQYELTPLLDLALEHLASGTELNFTDRHGVPCKWINTAQSRLLKTTGTGGHLAMPLGMQTLEIAIQNLRPLLKPAFADALSQYWAKNAFSSSASPVSQWSWLSDTLQNTLRIAALKQPGLDDLQRQTLDQVTRYPDPAERAAALGDSAAQVFIVDSTLSEAGKTATVLSPDLLITRQVNGRQVVLHASAAGVVTPYSSRETFAQAWERQLNKDFVFDQMVWKRSAPDGSIFDTQAAILLDRQLQNIEAIQLPTHASVEELEQLFSQASATAPWFSGALHAPSAVLEPLARTLPDWLKRASGADRFTYRQHALALASSVQRSNGRNFLTDIPDLHTYAEQQLDAQLAAKGYRAKDLEITFKVPVGTLGGGYIEPVKMSLVQMALENLAGLPKGAMDIRLRGVPVTDPKMAQQLKDLISLVDIGKHYPALLETHLLGDTAQSRERQALFSEQVPVQLTMQAMEFKLRGENGLTARGCQLIEAAVRPGAGPRTLDGADITVRPLAFLRKPGATPDVVDNMFLIEPHDPQKGPHILYRPQLSPPLQEFASREALLTAIQQSGPLQQSILAWLPDAKTRAVYGNGGFHTPHIAHYSVFNEFDAPQTPAPTRLAVDGYAAAARLQRAFGGGDLMKHLFSANAHSLVSLAKDQSASDTESRWASHKELGWLLFNSLLPVLRGPGAMVGWLLQMAAVDNDIQRASDPGNPDPTAAIVDLLVNMGTLLSHSSAPAVPERPLGALPFAQRPEVALPLVRPADTVANTAPGIIREAPSATAGQFIETAGSSFDFAFSASRDLSATQRAHIASFAVQTPAHPGEPISKGATQGLYSIDGHLHVRIDRQWFRVARDLDGPFIIDAQDKTRSGPPIQRDAQGQWRLDISPKLRGGMPKGAMGRTVSKNMQAKALKDAEYRRNFLEGFNASEAHGNSLKKMGETLGEYEHAHNNLRKLWELKSRPDSAGLYDARYAEQRRAADALRAKVDQQLLDIEPLSHAVMAAGEKTVESIKPKKLAGLDDVSEYKQNRSLEYRSMLGAMEEIEDVHRRLFNVSNRFTASGEPLATIIQAAREQSAPAYDATVAAFKTTYRNRVNLAKAKQSINTLFEQWKADSPYGANQAEQYIKERYTTPPDIDLLSARLSVLTNLKELSINRGTSSRGPDAAFFLKRFGNTPIEPVNQAFRDQREYQGYTLEERKATLQTVISTYQQSLNDSIYLQETCPDLFRGEYHALFTQHLGEIITDAEADLAQVIREEQHLMPESPGRTDRRVKPRNQRVFHTRDKKTLIGTLRPAEAGRNDIIDVLDPATGNPLASYSEHPSQHEWVEIVRGPSVQAPRLPSPKSLRTYKAEAQQLLDEADKLQASITYQKRKLSDPARRDTVNPLDWYDMLRAQADRLREVARQTQANHSGQAETGDLVAQWKTAADNLQHAAIQHTAEGYLVQPPKPENVDFLWLHGFVDINLVKRDVPTKSGDVFTEYAVREKGKINVLWYAHFHYPEKGAVRNTYTAAHLKIPSQRTKTQKDLIREAGNNRLVEQIIRSRVSAPLDEKLFLKL